MWVPIITFVMPIMLIVIIGSLLYFVFKRKPVKQRRWLSSKKIHMILAGYVGILIISAGIYFILPKQEIEGDKETLANISEVFEESDKTLGLAYEGDFEKIDEKYIKHTNSFPYNNDRLEVDDTAALTGDWIIIIERKETDDSEIDMTYYETPSRMNGVDVSSYFGEVDIQLESSRLSVSQNSVQELSFSQFSKPFLLSQFDDSKDRGMEFNYNWGNRIIHLRIPKELEIINEYDDFIHYMDVEPQ